MKFTIKSIYNTKMEMEIKHNVKEKVFFLHNNKVTSDIISAINIIISDTVSIKYNFYNTNCEKYENECFKSKEELINSL